MRIISSTPCLWSDSQEALRDIIERAYKARKSYKLVDGSYRLVNSDGDRLSGLIVDVYSSEVAVVQSSSLAIDSLMDIIVDEIIRLTGVDAVYEKSIQRSRKDIGLPPKTRWLKGKKQRVIIEENGAKYIVDVVKGQKTGFYLDQKPNRIEFSTLVSQGDRVLDVFSYTGGFGIQAALKGAREVTFIEEDPIAASILVENLKLNKIENYRIINDSIWNIRDVPERQYDLIAVDPPAFIQSGDEESVRRGVKAYTKVYTWSLERGREGSIIYLSSCSYFLTRDIFLNIISTSAMRAGVDYKIMGSLRGAGPDHTLRGEEYLDYLKGAFIYLSRIVV